jgi:chorismate lyase
MPRAGVRGHPSGPPALGSDSVTRWRNCDSMVLVANRLGLRAALDRTSGTVTAFLEQLVGETIDAQAHRHDIVEAHKANGLGVEEGKPLLHRAASLRGRTSGRSYVYAESIIDIGRLPTGFANQLETSTDPIGRILEDMGVAVTRQGVGEPDGVPQPNNDMKVGDYLLARTYRIDSEQTPVMIITEWFLKPLIPFLSLA